MKRLLLIAALFGFAAPVEGGYARCKPTYRRAARNTGKVLRKGSIIHRPTTRLNGASARTNRLSKVRRHIGSDGAPRAGENSGHGAPRAGENSGHGGPRAGENSGHGATAWVDDGSLDPTQPPKADRGVAAGDRGIGKPVELPLAITGLSPR